MLLFTNLVSIIKNEVVAPLNSKNHITPEKKGDGQSDCQEVNVSVKPISNDSKEIKGETIL